MIKSGINDQEAKLIHKDIISLNSSKKFSHATAYRNVYNNTHNSQDTFPFKAPSTWVLQIISWSKMGGAWSSNLQTCQTMRMMRSGPDFAASCLEYGSDQHHPQTEDRAI